MDKAASRIISVAIHVLSECNSGRPAATPSAKISATGYVGGLVVVWAITIKQEFQKLKGLP
jgi:hypothetical protein